MGTSSYVLAGTSRSEARAFSSSCHGAGRRWSRSHAKRQAKGRAVIKELAAVPEAAKFADDVQFTENNVVIPIGKGLWNSISKVAPTGMEAADPLTGAPAEVAAELGLGPDDFSTALQTLCEDLLQPANALGSLTSCLDDAALVAMVDEIDDPSLRAKVVGAVQAAVAADRHLSDGEQVVLGTLRRRWGDVAFGRADSVSA